jgi:hypothetical protein
MMHEARTRNTSRLTLAIGAVAAGSAACLATYFTVGGPFGTINDIGNAATGVLSGWLAWRLHREPALRTGNVFLGSALAGAALTVAGSALVVSGTTGWLYAGLVSSVGFAGIGAWLVATSRRSSQSGAWPRNLARHALVAGGLLITGVLSLPGIPLRLDDPATAPWWIWLGFVSWLGTYVVYPAWAIRMGLAQGQPAALPRVASAESGGQV